MQKSRSATSHAATRELWRRHVAEQARNTLSQRAYCERYGLTLSSFTRWRRILSQDPIVDHAADRGESAFVAVAVERSAAIPSGISLTLPSGLRIDGVQTSDIPTVVALVRAL